MLLIVDKNLTDAEVEGSTTEEEEQEPEELSNHQDEQTNKDEL